MKLVPFADTIACKYSESVVFVVVVPDLDGNEPNVIPAGWSMFILNEPSLDGAAGYGFEFQVNRPPAIGAPDPLLRLHR
jgi:hypothetical protein